MLVKVMYACEKIYAHYLTEAVDAEYRLRVIGRIPAGVKDDTAVGADQVDADAAGPGRDQVEAGAWTARVIEGSAVFGALGHVDGAVQAEVVFVLLPALSALREMREELLDQI